MRRVCNRLRFAWSLWRCEDYDGLPTDWAIAWDIASAWYRPQTQERTPR